MSLKIAFVIDPIETLIRDHDSTISLMNAALSMGCEVTVTTIDSMFTLQDQSFAMTNSVLSIDLSKTDWFQLEQSTQRALTDFDIIMMRKDPPFNMRYIFSTYLLEQAEKKGVRVLNKPSALRDCNEKLFILDFPNCITDTLVSARTEDIIKFHQKHKDIILKPLDGMGGKGIFRVTAKGTNLNAIIETLTDYNSQYIMVQRYLPEITEGDKRILLIDGKPLPYALLRVAPPGETRANLAAGASYKAATLTEHDTYICEQLGKTLKEKGLFFVGIDIIGNALTEINVTCPTCVREIETTHGVSLGLDIMKACIGNLPAG